MLFPSVWRTDATLPPESIMSIYAPAASCTLMLLCEYVTVEVFWFVSVMPESLPEASKVSLLPALSCSVYPSADTESLYPSPFSSLRSAPSFIK